METQTASTRAAELPLFASAPMGTALTILSGLSFLFLGMVLPLVGRAGVQTVHASANRAAFLAALLAALALSALATLSKLARRRIDRSPLPVLSLALVGFNVLLLAALLLGLLAI